MHIYDWLYISRLFNQQKNTMYDNAQISKSFSLSSAKWETFDVCVGCDNFTSKTTVINKKNVTDIWMGIWILKWLKTPEKSTYVKSNVSYKPTELIFESFHTHTLILKNMRKGCRVDHGIRELGLSFLILDTQQTSRCLILFRRTWRQI